MMTRRIVSSLGSMLRLGALGAGLGIAIPAAHAQPAATPVPAATSGEQSAQAQAMLSAANDLAADAAQAIEHWVATNAVTEDRLFDRLYFPVPEIKLTKFTTSYDTLADRDFPTIQDKAAARSGQVVFAIITDVNGYVPTHNARFAQPITGNTEVDVLNHRTKQIKTDPASIRAGRSEAPYLFQQYRFAGEQVTEVSVPVKVRGRHFGCVRIAYRTTDK